MPALAGVLVPAVHAVPAYLIVLQALRPVVHLNWVGASDLNFAGLKMLSAIISHHGSSCDLLIRVVCAIKTTG